jgi:hypothetical protein
MLQFLASKGLELVETQLGLNGVPQEHVEAFDDQSTLFLQGYATCLSDIVALIEGPLYEKSSTIKTLSGVVRTWLYLCSYTISKRDKPHPSA